MGIRDRVKLHTYLAVPVGGSDQSLEERKAEGGE
jgi:hypothetical protein